MPVTSPPRNGTTAPPESSLRKTLLRRTMTTRTRPKRWRRTLLIVVALVGTIFLLVASLRESAWRVRFDFANWRLGASETVHFDPGGRMIQTTKAYNLGPLIVSSKAARGSTVAMPGVNPRPLSRNAPETN